MHNLQTRTIYTFSIYRYSLEERAHNNQCKFFSPLLCFYTRSSLVLCPIVMVHPLRMLIGLPTIRKYSHIHISRRHCAITFVCQIFSWEIGLLDLSLRNNYFIFNNYDSLTIGYQMHYYFILSYHE